MNNPRGEFSIIESAAANEKESLIWLPNALITGTVKAEESPVRRLRRSGDVWTLRLLVDLYASQNLRDDGGISPLVLRQNYDRRRIGEQGIFNVWAFRPGDRTVTWTTALTPHGLRPQEGKEHPIWDSIRRLEREGLLAYVPHLWDNNTREAEIIHSYGVGCVGEPAEIAIGNAAQNAALAMVPDFKVLPAFEEGFEHLVPVKASIEEVQMIGVGRLRYRPRTKRTRDWFGDLRNSSPTWVKHYQSLASGVTFRSRTA